MQKILLVQFTHSVDVPGIHSGHVQEVEEHSEVPSFVFATVGIHCDTLIHEIYPSHMLIVKLHRKWPLDVEHLFFFLALSLGQVRRGLANTGRGHVNHGTIQPVCESDVFHIGDNGARSSSFFEFLFTFQLQLCSLEPVASACASAIDALLFQCLNKWNAAKEIVKKHLVILLLYVIT